MNRWNFLRTRFSLFPSSCCISRSAMILLIGGMSLSLGAMDRVMPEKRDGVQEERCLSAVHSEATQKFVLRLVIFNCVQRGDFEGVTHLIEKTRVHPGKFFTDLIETGRPVIMLYYYLKKFNVGVFGYSYLLYKAAHQAGHKLLIRLIRDAQALGQAEAFASLYEDSAMAYVIREHPDFQVQKKEYENLMAANQECARIKPRSEKRVVREVGKETQQEILAIMGSYLARHKKMVQEERKRLQERAEDKSC